MQVAAGRGKNKVMEQLDERKNYMYKQGEWQSFQSA
jgi:hypothetical protein